ncbi:MAG: acyl--CoA ligase, partial [Clostridiaceae bacterium]|nr:acyl--CoA ligase [Clostridiaceae bacterium]
MSITQILEKNARLYADDVCLVEINPEIQEKKEVTWKEYELIEANPQEHYRKEITWKEFDDKANRFANFLLANNIKKGNKVAILLMNCIEWLPIYFGILKTGALVVPLNYRYTADEIKYCIDLSEADAMIFGFEFIGRVKSIKDKINHIKPLIYTGKNCPDFAISYEKQIKNYSETAPDIEISDEEDAALYF